MPSGIHLVAKANSKGIVWFVVANASEIARGTSETVEAWTGVLREYPGARVLGGRGSEYLGRARWERGQELWDRLRSLRL